MTQLYSAPSFAPTVEREPIAAPPRGELDLAKEAARRGATYLLGQQQPEGYWWAELEANVTMASEHLMLEHFLGIRDETRWRKLTTYLLRRQSPDGSWPIYYGGPGDVSVTTEAYFALKLAGIDVESPALQRARAFIRDRGGIAATRIFTRLWLSLFGQSDWNALPVMPPEAFLLPNWSPLNIYEFACWARGTMVPILLVSALRPVVPVPESARIDELYLRPTERQRIDLKRDRRPFTWRNAFLALDRLLRLHERSPWKPLRKRAVRAAERWIVAHQEADGSWGGIQPPWVYSLIALKSLGYANDHPVMARGIHGLWNSFALETEDEFTVQPCLSPIWDTALAVTGLREAGVPADHPSLLTAAEWLYGKEIRTPGDWCVKVKCPPGGWAFEFHNDWYPDTDDTAEVLIALRLVAHSETPHPSFARADRWLRGMQSSNGGWGAFDKDNNRAFVSKIPFADFGATLDPPTEDVTAHVVEWLALAGADRADPAVRRALAYLFEVQEDDGAWWGRWGVNYIYGLGAVIPALVAAGISPTSPRIRRGVAWLEARQNADGGWGESCASYEDPAARGVGPSTASQTAWALLALLGAGELDSAALNAGIRYLAATQQSDGNWDEPEFTGTGFPRDFMLNYHMYRSYWPLWALGRFVRLKEGRPIHLPGSDPWA